MPFLNALNFDTVHQAVNGMLAENTPEARQLLRDAKELLDAAARDVADEPLRQRAIDKWVTDDLEIDDEAVGVARADDGVWVQAWVWMHDPETEDA